MNHDTASGGEYKHAQKCFGSETLPDIIQVANIPLALSLAIGEDRANTVQEIPMDEKERARALELTLGQIEKQFGKGSILRLGSKEAIVPISVISTGSLSVDAALGIGGFPRGRICEVYGPESSGKTTIALQVVAQAQKAGGMAAFIDVEHALDPI